jgi:hypothetical protein
MKKLSIIIISALLVLNFTRLQAQINVEKYLWEYPSHSSVDAPDELILTLKNEIQKILELGYLRPLSIRYADQMVESYIIYREPARMMQTLAEAFPFLDSLQKTQVKTYVNQMFDDPVQQFWLQPSYTNRFVPADYGVPRQLHPSENVYGSNSWWGNYRPNIQTIYQFWNYAYRTGDSSIVSEYYYEIKDFYFLKLGYGIDPGNLYGTMCAHIGMARLALMMDDQEIISEATANLQEQLTAGLDIKVVDSMAYYGTAGWTAPYPASCDAGEYCGRKDDYIHRGFIFLNLSPEIGRYLQEHVLESTLARHERGFVLFPFWWLLDAPYWARWAGDETVGIPTEMFGMVLPIEKWVKNTPGANLEKFFTSAPKGIGDCYWIEGLVLALEAFGDDVWKDCRNEPFSFDFAAKLPVITQQPQSKQALEGTDAAFQIHAQSTEALFFEWFGTSGSIANSNNDSLILENVTLGNSGFYYCKVSNSKGSVISDSAVLTVYLQHQISIPKGWSGISSYLNPLNDTTEALFEPLHENLIILQSGSNVFWPSQQVNTLENWEETKGYMIKTANQVSFMLAGVPSTGTNLALSSGWNLLPVLKPCEIPVQMISDILGNKLVLIKEAAGYKMYWPVYGIATLAQLEPGRAYWILINQQTDFSFPDCQK